MSGQKVGIREIKIWKHSECIDCKVQHRCRQGRLNITTCIEKDSATMSHGIDALLRRTIRALTAKHTRKEYKTQSKKVASKYPWKPFGARKPIAVMHCSDLKEYKECQQ